MNKPNLLNNYFLILVSIIPLSILVGATISLSNIILLTLTFLFFSIYKRFLFLLKDPIIISLLIIYLYLILNSIISINPEIGIYRNLGFFRFILLFASINYLFFFHKKIDLVFKIWLLIILIVLFDSYIEFIFGKNIMGYGDLYGARIVSFFKDEPIVAAFLNGFVFILFGYLFQNFDNKNIWVKSFIYLLVLSFLFCIIITGERSNTIKFLFGLLVFFGLNHHLKFKFKILAICIVVLLFTLAYVKSDYVKYRYGSQLFTHFLDKEQRDKYLNNSLYLIIYKSGFEVFKNYPIFGVGNKNYRVETCSNSNSNAKYYCITHPHQIYIELLAEHGIFGSIILLSIIFFLIFRNLKAIILSRNLIQVGAFAYLLTNFLPILPSGSFFNDFNSTIFWLNVSILYASNPKTNIFKNYT